MISSIAAVGAVVTSMWSFAFCFASYGRLWATLRPSGWAEKFWRCYARIHQELWPFAPPGLLLALTEAWSEHRWWQAFLLLVGIASWWFLRNWPDDENRWRRRGRKLRAKVAQRAGRLVVVPAGAPS